MSSAYVSEPPTKGKVVLHTTMGPLDIELWPKEAPKATRNFVQLCLESYFDGTIFHRIIKSFLVQGGDPTGTGAGGETIYGGPFADEFHSRLRFNHRGLVACANAGTPHSNGSQFFVTLDRCDWLNKKNTIFGKVTGDSVYNLLRIGDVETDKDDRPLDPQPKILSVEVLWNPFEDIVPREVHKKLLSSAEPVIKALDNKKKTVKKLNLLSFGEEAEEYEKELGNVKEKIKSIHDVLDDPRFLKEEPQKKSLLEGEKKDSHIAVREALTAKKGEFDKQLEKNSFDTYHSDDDNDDDDGARFDARMKLQILKKRQEQGDIAREKSSVKHIRKDDSVSLSRENGDDDDGRAVRVEKLAMKKKGIGSEVKAERMAKADTDLQLLGLAEQERMMKKQKRRRLQGREDDTLARLNKFKQNISTNIVASTSKVGEENKDDDEEDVSGWLTKELKFTSGPSNKNSMARREDPNDYVVHDPLLEKGKEKFNKMQAKLKRKGREWAGRSLT